MQKMFLLVGVLMTGLSGSAVAQTSSALREGVRLEIRPVNAKPRTGTLISVNDDSLLFARSGSSQRISMPLTEIRSVKVSRGRSHLHGALTKGLIGTGVGLLIGGVAGAVTWHDGDFFCERRAACVALGGIEGGVLGLVAGTFYGAIRGDERWETIDSLGPSRF